MIELNWPVFNTCELKEVVMHRLCIRASFKLDVKLKSTSHKSETNPLGLKLLYFYIIVCLATDQVDSSQTQKEKQYCV